MKFNKKIRNRLILIIGLILAIVIIGMLVKGISHTFFSNQVTVKGAKTLRKAGMSEADIKEMTSLPNYHSSRAKRYAK